MARRGYSRDHRLDCKQVCIALVVTFDGFPLGCEVFGGNTHDSRTVQTIVDTMEARHGVVGRVWIADRGMASAANLAWLRQTGRRYIIGAPKAELRKFAAELVTADGRREIRQGIEVKLGRWPDTAETAILCCSADRRSKEQAMHDKFSRRNEAALARLAGRIEHSTKRLKAAQVNRQIGRILQQTQRSAARFHITLQAADCPAGFRLHVEHDQAFDYWAALSEGAYVLHVAHQHRRLERRAAVESLHSAHPGRGRLPHPQGSAARATDLAAARGPRQLPTHRARRDRPFPSSPPVLRGQGLDKEHYSGTA